jgi:hypothetical protein
MAPISAEYHRRIDHVGGYDSSSHGLGDMEAEE